VFSVNFVLFITYFVSQFEMHMSYILLCLILTVYLDYNVFTLILIR